MALNSRSGNKFSKTLACGLATAVAAGTGDATAVTGQTVDRLGYDTARVDIAYKTVLADTKTLSYAVEYQDSADGTTWNTAVAMQAATVQVTASGATTAYGVLTLALNIVPLDRYIRINFTPDLSASGTDTAISAATVTLLSPDVLPAA